MYLPIKISMVEKNYHMVCHRKKRILITSYLKEYLIPLSKIIFVIKYRFNHHSHDRKLIFRRTLRNLNYGINYF